MISQKMKVLLAACAGLILMAGSAFADIQLYATSRENSQLVQVNLTTNTITQLKKVTGFPDSMIVTNGVILYDIADLSEVHSFNLTTLVDTLIADSTNGINEPQDMVLDPSGNSIVVANYLGGTLTRILLNGTQNGTTLKSGVVHPEGLAYDPSGHLFALVGFGSASATVIQIDPTTGATLKQSTAFDPTNTLDGLAYDTYSNALYASSKNGSLIYKIDPTTLVGTAVAGSGTIITPDGLISNNNGLLYIVSRGDFHVYQLDLTTNPATPTQLTLVPGLDDLGGLVIGPPTILKAFGVGNLQVNNSTTLTITVTNTNPVLLSGISYTDTLPAGLVVSTPNGQGGTCNGTVTAVAGSTSVALSGQSLASNASCTVIVNVTATATGPQNNCVTVTATSTGPGNTSCALLTVLAAPPIGNPPVIGKAFGATTVPINTNTTLTITVSNPNVGGVQALGAVGFNDTLPSGLVVATPNGLGGTCNGTATATAGSSSVTLAGASLAVGASCTVTLNVTGTTIGVKNNAVTVFDTLAGTGNTGTATTTVVGPPVLAKVFGAQSPYTSVIQVGGTTSLTFTVQNPNATVPLTNVSFTDNFPPGAPAIVIATPNGLTGSCGGGTITAVSGTTTVSLTGATLAGGASCEFTVNVTGTALGVQLNTTGNPTGVDPNSNVLTGLPATASLTIAPPSLDPYQIRYAANLDKGDSYINFSNAGTLSGADPAGRICVNVYTFDPAEELISCCSCLVTPNGINSLSAKNDLISNTLTAGKPTSIVIKLIASTPNAGSCNASTPNVGNLVRGMRAWGTTLHALPTIPSTYGTTETPFSPVELSPTELQKLTSFCGFIQSNGSGFGICKSCQTGAQGGETK